MDSDNNDSEIEAGLQDGVNGDKHEEDAVSDQLDDADDGDLFGDGSGDDASG